MPHFPICELGRMMPTVPLSKGVVAQRHGETENHHLLSSHWLGRSLSFPVAGLWVVLTLMLCCSILMAGILPFGAMFIELFFIFSVSTGPSPPPYATLLLGHGLSPSPQQSASSLPVKLKVGHLTSGNPILHPEIKSQSCCQDSFKSQKTQEMCQYTSVQHLVW